MTLTINPFAVYISCTLQVKVGTGVNDRNDDPNTVYLSGPTYAGKFTVSDAGQSKYKGWTKEGTNRFKALRTLNEAARKSDQGKHVEKKALERIRAARNLTAASHDEERKAKRRKTTTTVQVDSDDDDEEFDYEYS